MIIIEETQLVKVEYLVNADTEAEALKTLKKMDENIVELSKYPEYIETVEQTARPLTEKEIDDPAVVRIQKNFFVPLVEKDEVKEAAKKLLRKRRKKASAR